MNDYIKRSDAIKAFDTMGRVPHEIIVDILNHVKAVDVVEVVRCNDCKHYESDGGALMQCEVSNAIVTDTDFCSYGERKTEEKSGVYICTLGEKDGE